MAWRRGGRFWSEDTRALSAKTSRPRTGAAARPCGSRSGSPTIEKAHGGGTEAVGSTDRRYPRVPQGTALRRRTDHRHECWPPTEPDDAAKPIRSPALKRTPPPRRRAGGERSSAPKGPDEPGGR